MMDLPTVLKFAEDAVSQGTQPISREEVLAVSVATRFKWLKEKVLPTELYERAVKALEEALAIEEGQACTQGILHIAKAFPECNFRKEARKGNL